MLIDLPSFAVGGIVGGVAAAIAWAVSRWLRKRQAPAPVPEANGLGILGDPETSLASLPRPRVVGGPPVPAAISVSADQIRLSERIIIALAREGRLGDDAPARVVRTQAGLASTLESNQSAVSKVLRRLVAAELLTEERRHVQGGSQRLKVYALTRRGELLAREVARRRDLSLLPERTGERKEPSYRANL